MQQEKVDGNLEKSLSKVFIFIIFHLPRFGKLETSFASIYENWGKYHSLL